ncbi:uncharacterized protein [Watersipora subatra]|uniref:uncharacterized protein n=1 Tax=Watersipora subatra TaxID=2589382 RepID=UPI00355AFEB4
MNIVTNSLKSTFGKLVLARGKKTSPYYKKKATKQISKALCNPKHLQPRPRKAEVGIARGGAGAYPSRYQCVEEEKLRLLGTQYKYDLYSIFQSGRYGSELAAIVFAKLTIAADGRELLVYWQQSGDKKKDASMAEKLHLVTDLVQSDFEELHDKVDLPQLKFEGQVNADQCSEELMQYLDVGEADNSEEDFSSRLPPLVFVQDVYGLDRSAILARLQTAPSSKSFFGADEHLLTSETDV